MSARDFPAATVQPQVSAAYRLLFSGWAIDGLLLDLYGTSDDDGAEVCAITLADSTIDLEAVTYSGIFSKAQAWMDEQHAQAAAEPEHCHPRTRARAALLERLNE